MRSSGLLTLTAVSGALAAGSYDTGSLPQCAKKCIPELLAGFRSKGPNGCSITDVACICRSPNFLEGTSCCVQENCSQKEIDFVATFAKHVCDPVAPIAFPVTCTQGPQSGHAVTAPGSTSTGTAAFGSSSSLGPNKPITYSQPTITRQPVHWTPPGGQGSTYLAPPTTQGVTSTLVTTLGDATTIPSPTGTDVGSSQPTSGAGSGPAPTQSTAAGAAVKGGVLGAALMAVLAL